MEMAEISHNTSSFEQVNQAASFLQERLPAPLRSPRVAIVCGTGLGGLVHTIEDAPRAEFDYSSIPHFPHLTVDGHAGKLVFGLLGQQGQQVPVVLMLGRAHYYEGHSINKVTFPVRVLKLLGIDTIILTNAAGGLNSEYAVGDIVLLNDHIFIAGLAGTHPLRGPNAEEFGPRFPPLSDAYDLELRRHVHKAWKSVIPPQSRRRLHEGVYAFVGGPSYETRAECRMLRQLGADLVGMSTVPEIVAARHCVPRGDDHLLEAKEAKELDVILKEGKANHEEVIEAARSAAIDMQTLVQQSIKDIFQQS